MDPNQSRRETCKTCGHRLPKFKTKFCTNYCARRFRHQKQASRDPARALWVKFLGKVDTVHWVDAERAQKVTYPDGVYSAQGNVVLVIKGRLVGWGTPTTERYSGALQEAAQTRRERVARERWQERRAEKLRRTE